MCVLQTSLKTNLMKILAKCLEKWAICGPVKQIGAQWTDSSVLDCADYGVLLHSRHNIGHITGLAHLSVRRSVRP